MRVSRHEVRQRLIRWHQRLPTVREIELEYKKLNPNEQPEDTMFYSNREPLEGPLTKRHAGEQRAGGGGYDWLRMRADIGDVFAAEALRRVSRPARTLHIIKVRL